MQCREINPSDSVQVDALQSEPYVSVWRSSDCSEITKVWHPEGSRGVYACAFSGGRGRYLATACGDNRHTLRVFEWSVSKVVAIGAGYNGVPTQVFGITWDPYTSGGEGRFVSFGIKHVKMWEKQPNKAKQMYKACACAWAGVEPRDVLCATFLPPKLEDPTSMLHSMPQARILTIGCYPIRLVFA